MHRAAAGYRQVTGRLQAGYRQVTGSSSRLHDNPQNKKARESKNSLLTWNFSRVQAEGSRGTGSSLFAFAESMSARSSSALTSVPPICKPTQQT
jgi:hypothetical protein